MQSTPRCGLTLVRALLIFAALSAVSITSGCKKKAPQPADPTWEERLAAAGGQKLIFDVRPSDGICGGAADAKTTSDIVSKRLNALGLPCGVRYEEGRIHVLCPGMTPADMPKAKSLEVSACLTVRAVDDESDALAAPAVAAAMEGKNVTRTAGRSRRLQLESPEPQTLRDVMAKAVLPAGREAVIERLGGRSDSPMFASLILHTDLILSGKSVTGATANEDEMGYPFVRVTVDAAAAKAFGDFTAANVDKRIAILVDDEVMSTPVIAEAIPGGEFQVSMPKDGDAKTLAAAMANRFDAALVFAGAETILPAKK